MEYKALEGMCVESQSCIGSLAAEGFKGKYQNPGMVLVLNSQPMQLQCFVSGFMVLLVAVGHNISTSWMGSH